MQNVLGATGDVFLVAAGYHMKIGKLQKRAHMAINCEKRKAACLLIGLSACVMVNLALRASEPAADAKLNAVLSDWKSIKPEVLQGPENAQVVKQLKALAKQKHWTPASVPLIRLGDSDTIQDCLAGLRSDLPNRRSRAIRQFDLAANAAVIPLLADDLNCEESPELLLREDALIPPLSTAAASVVVRIVRRSPVFNAAVKDWVEHVSSDDLGFRNAVCAWWKSNRAALISGIYAAVVRGGQLGEGDRGQSTNLPLCSLQCQAAYGLAYGGAFCHVQALGNRYFLHKSPLADKPR